MSETPETTKSAIPSDLDDRMKRFEERMADEEAENRRPFSRIGTAQEAKKVIVKLLEKERTHLKTGHFSMEAQRQAKREEVEDLGYLVEDLDRLVNILASMDD